MWTLFYFVIRCEKPAQQLVHTQNCQYKLNILSQYTYIVIFFCSILVHYTHMDTFLVLIRIDHRSSESSTSCLAITITGTQLKLKCIIIGWKRISNAELIFRVYDLGHTTATLEKDFRNINWFKFVDIYIETKLTSCRNSFDKQTNEQEKKRASEWTNERRRKCYL